MFRSRSTKGVALLMLLAPAALGSCVADGVSLRITCNVVAEGDCTYTTAGACWIGGSLNLLAVSSYSAVLRLSNGLKSRDTEVPVQSEPNGIQISEVEVEIRDSAGRRPALRAGLPNPFTVRASGYIPPNDDGLVGADLLPRAYVNAIRDLERTGTGLGTISLSVIARGKTSGDVEVESAAWPWYIKLFSLSLDARDADARCVTSEEEVCNLGQDGFSNACDPTTVTEQD
jgi:hypothetical protein